jgi:hypothetical protein
MTYSESINAGEFIPRMDAWMDQERLLGTQCILTNGTMAPAKMEAGVFMLLNRLAATGAKFWSCVAAGAMIMGGYES